MESINALADCISERGERGPNAIAFMEESGLAFGSGLRGVYRVASVE